MTLFIALYLLLAGTIVFGVILCRGRDRPLLMVWFALYCAVFFSVALATFLYSSFALKASPTWDGFLTTLASYWMVWLNLILLFVALNARCEMDAFVRSDPVQETKRGTTSWKLRLLTAWRMEMDSRRPLRKRIVPYS